MSTLNERIRQARLNAGFRKMAEAARFIGVEPPIYRMYESGDRTPKIDTLNTMARKFRVSIEWLMTGKGGNQALSEADEARHIVENLRPEDRATAVEMLRVFLETKARRSGS